MKYLYEQCLKYAVLINLEDNFEKNKLKLQK